MRFRLLALCFLAWLPRPGQALAQGPAPLSTPTDLRFLDGMVLVVLDRDGAPALHAAHALIRSRGGRIAILAEPGLLHGWVPEAERQGLIGQAGIRAIHAREVPPGTLERRGHAGRAGQATIDAQERDLQQRYLVEYFNGVKRGDVQARAEIGKAQPGPALSDAYPREPLEEWAYLQNLQANGFDIANLRDRGLLAGKASPWGIQGNSDRMTGTVTVTLLFVESDGTGADPNTYTWTSADVQRYIDGVNTGLAWWTTQAENYHDCWVAFFVRYVPPTDSRCRQWREMVLHPSGDVGAMASEIMGKFGYSSGGHTTRVDAFNTAQRATYGTNWAYTGFVAYNPLPAPAQLTDGPSAFAYLLGPYTFLLYRSFGWLPEQVFPHESGHIFGACDEYADGCACGALCLGKPNDNCEDCPGSVACMMKLNSYSLCSYTDEQVGWLPTQPCAPPPLAPPVALSIQPAAAYQGTSLQVTITGANFLYGAFASLGPGIQIQSTTLVGTNTLQLQVSIDNGADPGPRDVAVSNRDLQSSTLSSGFQVLRTTRHYYSPTGGNVFPYITRAGAASSLADAMSAAGAEDSVLVPTGTLPLGSLVIAKGIVLYGGWDSDFTQRDLAGGRTVLDLVDNVSILVTGGGTGGLDGFVLRNGRGFARSTPVPGSYGGAVFILSSAALVANCDIHTSRANAGSGFGGGGGIFTDNSQVTLVNNTIHDNTATRGGGIYLYNSSGSLTGNTVNANAVSTSTQPAAGGGIYIEACTSVSLDGNVVRANTGATNGGGLVVVGSSDVTVQGGEISAHAASNNGGGAVVDASGVAFTGVAFAGNSSASSAGALAAANGSALALDECLFLSNTALFYGAVHASGSSASVRHNLFVDNSSSAVAGALTLVSIGTGEVTGNTLDRNRTNFGAGGVSLSDATLPVTNNIVTNSTGSGIGCSGTPLTRLEYNLVWNSSAGNYTGCSPGVGSLSADPLFANEMLVDYHLAAHSPAIDAGRTDPGSLDPDGSRGDLGWYGSHSFVTDQPSYPKNLQATRVAGDVVLAWTANPDSDVAFYAVYCDTTSGFRPGLANFVLSMASPDTSANLGPAPAVAYYTLSAVDNSGYASGFAAEAVLSPATDVVPPLARRFLLHQNVPNPFNPTTHIRYELDREGWVVLEVFDLSGRLVRTLVRERRDPGAHVAAWDGTDARGRRVPSGVYLYRLESTERVQTRKMVAVK